ncbi:MAG: 3'-5' exonuclease [Chloroflexi bacterium]|nr:3'-5' exonuclease [Chloroflexota bacterium]
MNDLRYDASDRHSVNGYSGSIGQPNRNGARVSAQQWAHRLLARRDWVVLDTETTGLDGLAEVVQLAVVDPNGATLLDTLIRPTHPIPRDATAIHGITDDAVAHAPPYPVIYPDLFDLVQGKTIVAYNANYDARVLRQTALLYGIGDLTTIWQCAMEQYARYVGRWSNRHGHFMWQPLPRTGSYRFAKHQALDDCRATLDLIHHIATGTI